MFFSRLRRCFSQKPSPYTPTSPPVRMEEKTSWTRGIDHQKEDISWGNNEEKSSVAMYRIENELKSMNEEVATHCSFGPVGDDIFRWEGVVIGPAGSCYEGGIFHVSIQFPSDYPFTPPSINFLTKVCFLFNFYIFIIIFYYGSNIYESKLIMSDCSFNFFFFF